MNKYLYEGLQDGDTADEPCPNCGDEVEINLDGKSECPNCGHKNILPCSVCELGYNYECDWSFFNHCSPFPKQ